MARIEPLTTDQWPLAMHDALTALAPPDRRQPRLVQTGRPKSRSNLGAFAHHPELARAFLTFNGHILMSTTLSARQRELLVMRVATVRQCAYEWANHIFLARDAGLTDEEIARIAFGPNAPFWSDVDAALLRAVDELIETGAIESNTWNVLASELDERQLLDLIFTVGAYETIAWMMRSLDLDLALDENMQELIRDYEPPPPAEDT